jgi:universal stress protein A
MTMELIHRILCPVDFSDTSMKAVKYAERLASQTGSELLLVHAFERPESYGDVGQTTPADPQLEKNLEAIELGLPAEKVRRLLHAGDATDVIPWMAQEEDCDLIVMGTHGRGGLMHLLLGSVTEHVLRHARCPVLTIRDRPENEPPLDEPRVVPLPPPGLM